MEEQLKIFLKENLAEGETIDLFLHGENGDSRLLKYYEAAENCVSASTTVARFKHAFGEFQTVPALALWLTTHVLQTQKLPEHFIKRNSDSSFNRILIYNNYQGAQHGFMLVEKVNPA